MDHPCHVQRCTRCPLWPSCDHLYVVSDLHLSPNTPPYEPYRFSRLGDLLGRTIAHIDASHPEQTVTLVLAGDVFDFLAGPSTTPFKDSFDDYFPDDDPLLFIQSTLESEPVLTSALTAWIGAARRHLVVMSGNHDVELGLKQVQDKLTELLTAGMNPLEQNAAVRRLEFSADGTGYRCTAGDRSVWCFHGEASDSANYVHGSSIRKRIRSEKAGFRKAEPHPSNPGTDLVVTALNAEKRAKGNVWVDLLKPEYEICFPLLVYLDGLDYQRVKAAVVAAAGVGTTSKEVLSGGVRPGPGASLGPPSHDQVRASIERARGKKVLDGPLNYGTLGAGVSELLSMTNLAWWARRGFSEHSFFAELSNHRKESEILEIGVESNGPKQWAADQNGARVDVIIAGHTHARKRIVYDGTKRVYLNTGTWASLIEVSKVDLSNLAERTTLFDLLSSRNAAALRALLDDHAAARSEAKPPPHQPLDAIRHCPTVAYVGGGVAELQEPIVDPTSQSITLKSVKSAF